MPTAQLPFSNGDYLVTVNETAAILRRSRSATYRLLAACELDSVRVQKNRRVRHSDLMRYIGSLRTVCASIAPRDANVPVPTCPYSDTEEG